MPIVMRYRFSTNEFYYWNNPEALKAYYRMNEDMWVTETVNGLRQATQET